MEEIKEEVAVEEVEESLDNENIKQLRQEYKKLKAIDIAKIGSSVRFKKEDIARFGLLKI